jgi:hypothetical protein
MGIELLTERHASQIAGVLGCFDRMLVFGTLPGVCFAGGITSFLYERNIRIFDYPKFAEPFRDRIRENAEQMAAEAGIGIEFILKRNVRKEDLAKAILAKRGEHPGLVCIFSAMEPCSAYKPWHNKQTGKTYLIADEGKAMASNSGWPGWSENARVIFRLTSGACSSRNTIPRAIGAVPAAENSCAIAGAANHNAPATAAKLARLFNGI